MDNGRGKFITLEGVEGVGKSTQLEAIADFLGDRKIDFITTREPGGTELAEKIRTLLLQEHSENLTDIAELLLIFAARAQHLQHLIIPKLDAGTWVVCDRFTDASFAYQGGGRQLGFKPIKLLKQLVQNEVNPDLTVLLDLPPQTGLRRVERRGLPDRFEREQLAFFNRVRESYLALAESEPERFLVVSADAGVDQVRQDLLQRLAVRLGIGPA